MIEVTATMLPSTVMNDRNLADQMASSAIAADSRSLFIKRPGRPGLPGPPDLPALAAVVYFHQIPIGHAANRVVGPRDHLISGVQTRQHFEILVAGDAHFYRHEFGVTVANGEHAFGLLARLAGLELRRRRDG